MKSMGISISKKTLAHYLKYVKEALFIFLIKRFSFKYRERAKYPVKIYLVDNVHFGIEPSFSKNTRRKMENVVALNLLRKKFEELIDEIFYFKVNNNEVDFVIKEGLEIKQFIQVTYASGMDEIEKIEIKALIKASELLKCKNLLVITLNYGDEMKLEDKKFFHPSLEVDIELNFISPSSIKNPVYNCNAMATQIGFFAN
mgnify:CR=1 FL=1